ncbi:unnamed protein product [Lymnaea stagnalis]|uniref:t-SNARE coiled-coil homology domain-containing protein n=2 Tax=Lymnaea stagnalis TaxID=6523 RepID=A0AAV2HYH5_LYMST
MSRYKQTSNPFEDDDPDGDFVVVDKRSTLSSSSSSSSQFNRTQPLASKNETVLRSSVNPSASSFDKSSISSVPNYNRQQKQNYSSEINSPDGANPFEDRHQHLIQQIENSENTQLESTQRALASIYDSEAMGIATAEELLRQAETLNNIETKTEGMQQNLKTSQRHLNNIKSVFGGIKNWWSSDKKSAQAPTPEESANSKLKTTIESIEKTKPDTSGFYDDEDVDARFMAGAKKPVAGQYSMITPVTRSAREEEVDQNLSLMCDGMSRLKGLALGLGDEIQRQNDQLDRINVKVDSTDVLLSHQNTQMRGILKK